MVWSLFSFSLPTLFLSLWFGLCSVSFPTLFLSLCCFLARYVVVNSISMASFLNRTTFDRNSLVDVSLTSLPVDMLCWSVYKTVSKTLNITNCYFLLLRQDGLASAARHYWSSVHTIGITFILFLVRCFSADLDRRCTCSKRGRKYDRLAPDTILCQIVTVK